MPMISNNPMIRASIRPVGIHYRNLLFVESPGGVNSSKVEVRALS